MKTEMKTNQESWDWDMLLSPHFTLGEMLRSGTAIRLRIDNNPQPRHVERLRALCQNVLEPLRRRFGAVRVTSGYRNPRLNKAVGGATASQHTMGEAADLHVSGPEQARKYCDFIRQNTPFDQLLLEHVRGQGPCWVHVSHKSDRGENRGEYIEMMV